MPRYRLVTIWCGNPSLIIMMMLIIVLNVVVVNVPFTDAKNSLLNLPQRAKIYTIKTISAFSFLSVARTKISSHTATKR